jgi:hypothetical protein
MYGIISNTTLALCHQCIVWPDSHTVLVLRYVFPSRLYNMMFAVEYEKYWWAIVPVKSSLWLANGFTYVHNGGFTFLSCKRLMVLTPTTTLLIRAHEIVFERFQRSIRNLGVPWLPVCRVLVDGFRLAEELYVPRQQLEKGTENLFSFTPCRRFIRRRLTEELLRRSSK